MTTIIVPAMEEDAEAWPSLGPQVCHFIESYLVFGPGDLRGETAKLTPEKRALIYRMYEVYPKGHAQEGRRRFRRVGISLRKGLAKTELAAWIAAVELHPEGPVRCDGFRKSGGQWIPVGRPVTDPYIPMVAYTEEQTEDLAYAALKAILELSSVSRDFDIGLERIMRKGGDGKAVALATAPNARDGARTTFQHKDETHLWTMPRLKKAAQTMTLNLAKRFMAEPWELETTTAFSPGEGSVAEGTFDYATTVADGKLADSRLFFFHRQAADGHDLSTPEGIKDAVIEATGKDNVAWSDIPALCDMAFDPHIDRAFWERMILNRPTQGAQQAFDVDEWRQQARLGVVIEKGETITLGFDGSRSVDSTALVATHVRTGFMWLLGIWERPQNVTEWEVPRDQVNAVVDEAFRTWKVWKFYIDPFHWDSEIAEWQGKYDKKKVEGWATPRVRLMASAIKAFRDAVNLGDLTHDGDALLERHIGNACRQIQPFFDDDGQPVWIITKDRPDSNRKIDAAIAAILSWQARSDAMAAGAANEKSHGIWIPA